MELNEILSKVDHTLLAQTATWAEIKAICDDGMKYHTASVCIPASYVKQAKDYVGDKLPICTVIGFPNGYDTTKAKCLEALDAVQNGADEVDMVINIGWVKDQRWNDLLEEIKAVKQHCEGKLLKVIIETCLLTDDEKIKMCEIVSDSGADYIKTSTGFGGGVSLVLGVLVAIIFAGLIAAFFAYLIGLPVLRLKSDYLAIATLGFAEILRAIFQWQTLGKVTNGANILKGYPTFADFNITNASGKVLFRLSAVVPILLAGICIFLIVLLINSSYGRAFKAIRDDEIAAEAMGINLCLLYTSPSPRDTR